jgi:peptide/nickel transport system permease protein
MTTRWLLGRLGQAVIVVLGVTIVAFFVLRLVPGNPAIVLLGVHYTPARAAALEHQLGLDRPVLGQYWLFIRHLFVGDLGHSVYYGKSVTSMVLDRLPVTIWLGAYSTLLALVISVPLASLSVLRPGGVLDHGVRVLFLVVFAIPSFWLGLLLILWLGLHAHVFPVGGYGAGFSGHLKSMFLPSLTIALWFSAILIRTLRNSMLAARGAEHIDTARAKGLSAWRIHLRHVVRNSLISAVSLIGINLAYLISGTVIIENVFALPGVGQLMVASIDNRDLSVVQGLVFLFGLCVVIVSFVSDLLYAWIDPRITRV